MIDCVSFVVESEGRMVAYFKVEIFRDMREAESPLHPHNLYRYFDMEAFSSLRSNGNTLSHARVVMLFVSPDCATKTNWYLREICRLTESSVLFRSLKNERPIDATESFINGRFFSPVRNRRG